MGKLRPSEVCSGGIATSLGPDPSTEIRAARRFLPTLPLQWKLTALVVIVVLFSGVVASYFVSRSLSHEIDSMVGNRLLGLATLIASRPEVRQAFTQEDPTKLLQPMAIAWMEQTGSDLIVFFNMDGVRYAHPNSDLVGQHFTGGDEAPALRGQSYISEAVGISGASLRAFAPVYDSYGRQVGVVAVGTWMANLRKQINDLLVDAGLLSLVGLAVGAVGAAAVAYNIKSSIFGLEPSQIGALLVERVAILQSLHEGVIAVDRKGRITLVNKEAEQMVGEGQELTGKLVTEVVPGSRLPNIVSTGLPEFDQEQVIRGTVVLTNRVPIVVEGKVVGAVATFRDMSEVRELATELTGVKQLAEALRAQAHEFVNRLHTVSGLLQLGRAQDAMDYIASATRTHEAIVGFVTQRIHEPALAGLLLGKNSAANERGISMSLDPDSHVSVHHDWMRRVDLVTLVGNLLENAFDAVATLPEEQRNVWISLYTDDNEMLIEVEDTGVGIPEKDRAHLFERGFTTKVGSKGIGLSLVMHEVSKVSGSLQVDSKVGEGTRFTVRLPVSNGKGSVESRNPMEGHRQG